MKATPTNHTTLQKENRMDTAMNTITVTTEVKSLAVKKAITYNLEKGKQILLALSRKDVDGFNAVDKYLYVGYLSTGQLVLMDGDEKNIISNPTDTFENGNNCYIVTHSFTNN